MGSKREPGPLDVGELDRGHSKSGVSVGVRSWRTRDGEELRSKDGVKRQGEVSFEMYDGTERMKDNKEFI